MKKGAFAAAGLFLFFGISLAWADATVETVSKFGGFKGVGAFEGTSVSRIQGLKMAEAIVSMSGASGKEMDKEFSGYAKER